MKVEIEIMGLTSAEAELICAHVSQGKSEGFGALTIKFFNWKVSDIQRTINENRDAIQAVYKK